MPNRRPSALVKAALVLTLAAGGCRATGRGANAYFDWGGRTFTTNPGSVAPYFLGFVCFFIAGLPLDIFSWAATAIGWSEGAGEDYQGAALAPSIFLGTTGGVILGAPFFPLGLPWWTPGVEETETPPPDTSAPPPSATKEDGTLAPDPAAASDPPPSLPARDPKDPSDGVPAGAPR